MLRGIYYLYPITFTAVCMLHYVVFSAPYCNNCITLLWTLLHSFLDAQQYIIFVMSLSFAFSPALHFTPHISCLTRPVTSELLNQGKNNPYKSFITSQQNGKHKYSANQIIIYNLFAFPLKEHEGMMRS